MEARAEDATASKPVAQLAQRRTATAVHVDVRREERAVPHGTLTPRGALARVSNKIKDAKAVVSSVRASYQCGVSFLNHWEDNRAGPGYF